jgi:outer membrane lipoprotein
MSHPILHAIGKICFVALLTGCAAAPIISEELRQEALKGPSYPEASKNLPSHLESTVLWGGFIVSTLNHKDETEVLVQEMPLDRTLRPGTEEKSPGRFIVVASRFLDPAIYAKEKEITVVGEIIGERKGASEEIGVVYPLVRARQLILWETIPATRFPTWYRPLHGSLPLWDDPFTP